MEMADIDNYLIKLFGTHGISLLSASDWLTTAGQLPACRSYMHEPKYYDGYCSVRVDIEVLLNDSQVVIECFGDAGESLEDALASSCQNFATSSLHVLLSAVWGQHDDDQVLRESWVIAGERWDAYVGNIVGKSTDGANVPIPADFFPAVERLVCSQKFSAQTHWIRVYFANINRNEQIVEVLLDNDVWEHGQQELGRVDWSVSDSFFSHRLFLMLLPTSPIV